MCVFAVSQLDKVGERAQVEQALLRQQEDEDARPRKRIKQDHANDAKCGTRRTQNIEKNNKKDKTLSDDEMYELEDQLTLLKVNLKDAK